jgi:multiple sugar transport system substrate-binding protein
VKRIGVLVTLALLAVSTTVLAAPRGQHAQSPSALPAPAATDTGQPITVWIDQPRQPAIDAYIAAHPDKARLITTSIVDREQFPDQVLLFNNTGSGWPDVVFAEPRLVGRVADEGHDFPLDLKGVVSDDVLSGYDGMAGCTFGDHVYCLRNDLAQFVLYYNKPLMDQFGYTVPTTFEELQALSDKVAVDHPGYLLGTIGDGWTLLSYLDASGCPLHELVDDNTLKIDPTDARCQRAAALIDHMVANKTLWNTDYFDATFALQVNSDKLLLMSGPAWMSGVFGGKPDSTWYTTADHQLGVAAPLKWADDAQAQTPAMGGAAWTVSKHTQNPGLAADLAQWVTTAPEYWSVTPNFPAYRPIQPLWEQQVASDPLFAADPFPVYQQAASEISSLDKWPRFDLIAPLTQTVKDSQTNGKTITDALPNAASILTLLAQSQGYTVNPQ